MPKKIRPQIHKDVQGKMEGKNKRPRDEKERIIFSNRRASTYVITDPGCMEIF